MEATPATGADNHQLPSTSPPLYCDATTWRGKGGCENGEREGVEGGGSLAVQEAPEAPAVDRRVLALLDQEALPAVQRQLPTRLGRGEPALLLLHVAVVVVLPVVLPLVLRVVLVREPGRPPPPRPVRPRGEVRAGVDALRGQGRAQEEPVRRLRAEDGAGRGSRQGREEQRRVLVQADTREEEEE